MDGLASLSEDYSRLTLEVVEGMSPERRKKALKHLGVIQEANSPPLVIKPKDEPSLPVSENSHSSHENCYLNKDSSDSYGSYDSWNDCRTPSEHMRRVHVKRNPPEKNEEKFKTLRLELYRKQGHDRHCYMRF